MSGKLEKMAGERVGKREKSSKVISSASPQSRALKCLSVYRSRQYVLEVEILEYQVSPRLSWHFASSSVNPLTGYILKPSWRLQVINVYD